MTIVTPSVSGCSKDPSTKSKSDDSTEPTKGSTKTAERPAIAHVPVGEFFVGSMPGEPGRNPALEPSEDRIELGPFRIDTRPYPGATGGAPRTGVSASEAAALCAERKGRLCTELEWERACRGSDSSRYPGGDSPCKDDSSCVSDFDVEDMGSLLEWTSSSFGKGSPKKGQPVARGAPNQTPAAQRRCSNRNAPGKDAKVGFRCCYGAPNAASIQEPTLGPPYKEVDLPLKEFKALLESDKRTAFLAKDAKFFKPEAARTVLARGPGDTKGFTLTTHALTWQPARGTRFLVVAGRSGKKNSFVVAYHVSDKKKTLAGSFLMKNEPGPIALAYADSIRPRVHFSSCWGCPGETGKVLFRDPEELVLLQP